MSIGEEHQDPVSIRQEMTQLRDEVHNALQAMRQDVDLASDVNAKLVALVDSVSALTKPSSSTSASSTATATTNPDFSSVSPALKTG